MVFSNDPAEISLCRMDVASESDSNIDSTGTSKLMSVSPSYSNSTSSFMGMFPNISISNSNSEGNSNSNGSDSDKDLMNVSGYHIGQNNLFSINNSSGSFQNFNSNNISCNQNTGSDSNLYLPFCKKCSNMWDSSVSCLGLCGFNKIPPSALNSA